MAKRKRLNPANPVFLDHNADMVATHSAMSRNAPIAEVARDASASAVAEELAHTLSEARANGRMVIEVSLELVQVDHLVRDRVVVMDEDMQALKDSLRARGQQTPVELEALGKDRYGLISGWRRCMALAALYDETKEARFASVLGLLRQPAEQADAYLSMVEENEIRAGLSYFERARIVAKAVEQGVYATDRAALQGLFQSASRAKRSKIGSFMTVVRTLDGVLRFPGALGERLGLQLARALSDDAGLAARLSTELSRASPDTAAAELLVLTAALAARKNTRAALPQAQAAPTSPRTVVNGISVTGGDGRLILEGRAVDADLRKRLVRWLGDQS